MASGWDPDKFRDYCREHSGEYEPVFWSGSSAEGCDEGDPYMTAQEAAEDYCSNHSECKTVGMVFDDAGLDQDDPNIDWHEASKIFAEESSGQPHLFVGEKSHTDDEENCYMKTERDAIEHNGKLKNDVDVHRVTSDGVQSGEKCSRDELPYFDQDRNLATDGYEEDEVASAGKAGERWNSVDSSDEYNAKYHPELSPENNEYAQGNSGMPEGEDNDYDYGYGMF